MAAPCICLTMTVFYFGELSVADKEDQEKLSDREGSLTW